MEDVKILEEMASRIESVGNEGIKLAISMIEKHGTMEIGQEDLEDYMDDYGGNCAIIELDDYGMATIGEIVGAKVELEKRFFREDGDFEKTLYVKIDHRPEWIDLRGNVDAVIYVLGFMSDYLKFKRK